MTFFRRLVALVTSWLVVTATGLPTNPEIAAVAPQFRLAQPIVSDGDLQVRMTAEASFPLTAVYKAPQTLRAMVMLVDFRKCGGQGPAITEREAYNAVFSYEADGIVSVDELLRGCSHGKTRIDPVHKTVVTIDMEQCSGQDKHGQRWAYNECPQHLGFNLDVDRRAMQLGINLSDYDYRWVVLDKAQSSGDTCWFAGLASLGCFDEAPDRDAPVCRTIFTSDYGLVRDAYLWLHEIGHNLNLVHSSTAGAEYGDLTCSMGGFDAAVPYTKCYNMPQSLLLGWARPQHSMSPHLYNAFRRFVLAPAATTDAIGIELAAGDAAVYVNFRPGGVRTHYADLVADPTGKLVTPDPLDVGLDTAGALPVHVHLLKASSNYKPVLVTSLGVGAEYTELATNLVIRVHAVNDTGATVSLCRRARWYHCPPMKKK